MFRKELLITLAIALAVFVLVALLASWGVRKVQTEGKLLAQDTLPGLVYAGEALNRMSDNWMLAHRLLNPESDKQRDELIRQINSNSTEPMWQSYKEAISEERDAVLFAKMEKDRDAFLQKRVSFFKLVEAHEAGAGKVFFEAELNPAFRNYRGDALAIFSFNVENGKERADRLIHLSRWTPFALGGLCVLILLVGVLVGFKASLGAFSGVWLPPASADSEKRLE